MPAHPTADRSFYDKMLAAHTRRHGAPSLNQRDYLREIAEDLVEDLGVRIEFASAAQSGETSEWSRSRQTAQWGARSPKHRVVRRFDTRSEDDD